MKAGLVRMSLVLPIFVLIASLAVVAARDFVAGLYLMRARQAYEEASTNSSPLQRSEVAERTQRYLDRAGQYQSGNPDAGYLYAHSIVLPDVDNPAGQLESALAQLDKTLSHTPLRAEAWGFRAQWLYRAGDRSSALWQSQERSLALGPYERLPLLVNATITLQLAGKMPSTVRSLGWAKTVDAYFLPELRSAVTGIARQSGRSRYLEAQVAERQRESASRGNNTSVPADRGTQ